MQHQMDRVCNTNLLLTKFDIADALNSKGSYHFELRLEAQFNLDLVSY